MDLVDDHGARRREHPAAGLGAEQDVERLRRGDDDVRRPAVHALALARRGIAGAHPGPDLDVRQPLRAQGLADAGERCLQVALDVVRQRLQRRDIDDLRLVSEPPLQPLSNQVVDRRQKGGKCLAGSRGRSDQRMPPRLDGRPRLRLGRRGRSEAAIEPGGDRRLEQVGLTFGRGPDRQFTDPCWHRPMRQASANAWLRPAARSADKRIRGCCRPGATSSTMPVRPKPEGRAPAPGSDRYARGSGRSGVLAVGFAGGVRRCRGGERYDLRFRRFDCGCRGRHNSRSHSNRERLGPALV